MEEDRYVDEFGFKLPRWFPLFPDARGRHATFSSAADAAISDLTVESNPFFEMLADEWPRLFPGLVARPGRYDDGKIFLYVANAPSLYMMRPRLAAIRQKLAALPSAPKKIDLRLEVHA